MMKAEEGERLEYLFYRMTYGATESVMPRALPAEPETELIHFFASWSEQTTACGIDLEDVSRATRDRVFYNCKVCKAKLEDDDG